MPENRDHGQEASDWVGGRFGKRPASSRPNRAVGQLRGFEEQAAARIIQESTNFRLVGHGRQKELVNDFVRQSTEEVNAGPVGGGGELRRADQVGRGLLA